MLEKFTQALLLVLEALGEKGSISYAYDNQQAPSHNYYFFKRSPLREAGFNGLEFDIHLDDQDAILIAVLDIPQPLALKLQESGYVNWYKDNWSGYPTFHEETTVREHQYHVEIFRCAKGEVNDTGLTRRILQQVQKLYIKLQELQ